MDNNFPFRAVALTDDPDINWMLEAAAAGDLEEVRAAVDQGVLAALGTDAPGPLLMAADNGRTDIVEFLIQAGESITKRSRGEQRTALMLAVAGVHEDVVRCLLAHGADPNDRDGYHTTPVLIASRRPNGANVARLLIAAGADVNACEPDQQGGWTALMWAAVRGGCDTMRVLLEAGADRTRTNAQGRTCTDLAALHDVPAAHAFLQAWDDRRTLRAVVPPQPETQAGGTGGPGRRM